MSQTPLRVSHDGPVTTLTLNRPDVRNALDASLLAALTEAFENLPRKSRVVHLKGAGKVFCAGADLSWMRNSAHLSEAENEADAAALSQTLHSIDTAPQAVVLSCHGAAIGGGAGLAATADVVIAGETCRFAFSEVRLGLAPAVIAPYVIRKIGVSAARQHFLCAESISAKEAQRLGLVHHAVADEALDERAQAIIETLLKGGPSAISAAKQLIAQVSHRAPSDVAQDTVRLIARLRAAPEGQEGVAAFLNKRKPVWQ